MALLFDLYLENNKEDINEPVIEIQGIGQHTDPSQIFTQDLVRIFQSIDQKKRDVIYIRRRPVESHAIENHWVIFYLFIGQDKKKNLLFVDTLTPYIGEFSNFGENIEKFLRQQNCNLYISTTRAQKDNNSCGPIAYEITIMLYNNYAVVKQTLLQHKKTEKDRKMIALDTMPSLKSEFLKLKNACEIKGPVNYGENDKELHAADIRIAHFAVALTIGGKDINNQICTISAPVQTPDPKNLISKIRNLFIGNKNFNALFKNTVLCKKNDHDSGYSNNSNNLIYAYDSFLLSGIFAIGASLTTPYLAICITFAVSTLTFLVVGCCYLYKAHTKLNNIEVDQIVKDADHISA